MASTDSSAPLEEGGTSTTTTPAVTLATTTTATSPGVRVQMLGSNRPLLPIRLPVQVVAPGLLATKGVRPVLATSSAIQVAPTTAKVSPGTASSTSNGGNLRKVVTLTPQQLSGLSTTVGAAGLKLNVTTATAAKVVHVQSATSLPNIIRNSANVTFIPTGKVVTPQQLKQQKGNTVKTVLELKGSVAEVVADISCSNKLDKAIVGNPTDLDMKSDLDGVVTTIIVNGKEDLKKQEDVTSNLTMELLLKPLSEPTVPGLIKMESSSVKCEPNEFGAIEVSVELRQPLAVKIETNDDDDIDLMCREDVPLSPKKETLTAPKFRDDELLCCEGCGRYGMYGDFLDPRSCSVECKSRIREKMREREKRERELLVQKQRREAKRKERDREREEKEAKERAEREALERIKKEEELQKVDVADKQRLSDNGSKGPHVEEGDGGYDEEEDEEKDEIENEDESFPEMKIKQPKSTFNQHYPWYNCVRGFSWSRYLQYTRAKSPSLKLFQDPFPRPASSNFSVGMKLEAIDPEHPSLLCVVSVIVVQGARLRLHFDSYSDSYDFWEDVDSPNIFPAGFAQSKGQKLEAPRGLEGSFIWENYLSKTRSTAAPKDCFPPKGKLPSTSLWEKGMKLEAVDKSNASLVCVATVANVMDGRVLIHFDGWEMDYDYWVTPHNSPYIHPVGWCQQHGLELNPPKNYTLVGASSDNLAAIPFSWSSYLIQTQSRAVPSQAFKVVRETSRFKKGMKLEVVDKRNPSLIRIATIVDVVGRQLKIHFDGWPDEYDFWMEDTSLMLHPPTWCFKTGHPLMPPLTPEEVRHYSSRGCPTPGCRGTGHVLGEKFRSHISFDGCPYSPQNMNMMDSRLPDRLQSPMQCPMVGEDVFEDTHGGEDSFTGPGNSGGEEGEGLGRGNRRRKRRKFFDEDEVDFNHSPKRFHGFSNTGDGGGGRGNGHYEPGSREVRESVFRPANYHRVTSLSQFFSSTFSPRDLSYKRVVTWTPKEVAELVSTLLPSLGEKFSTKIVEEELDGESFLLLTQNDLVSNLGLKLGPALKLFNAILRIKENE